MRKISGFGRNKAKGFTLTEVMIAIVIGVVIILFVTPLISDSRRSGKVDTATKTISNLQAGAQSWVTGRTSYAGLTCASLVPNFTSVISSCTGSNPWGGNYTTVPGNSCTGGNVNQFCITLTTVPNEEGARLVQYYTGVAAVTPTFSSGTLTLIFNG